MHMKKLISLLLVLALTLALSVPAFAGGGTAVPGETRTIGYYGYIDNEGGLWLWGPNTDGSAGQDPNVVTVVEKPTKVMDHVVSFARCNSATIVLKDDGSVWTFGLDYARGVYPYKVSKNYAYYKSVTGHEPVKVLDNCVAVAVGNLGQFGALGADGSLYGWGYTHMHGCGAAYGDPGITEDYFDREHGIGDVIKPYKILSDVQWFNMGAYNGLAVKKDGTVWYWGGDFFYEKNSNGGDTQPPVQLSGESVNNIKSAFLFNEGAYIIKTDGSLWRWGGMNNGKPINYKNPAKIGENVAMMASDTRGDDLLLLKPDGNLFAEGKWLAENVQWIAHAFTVGALELGGASQFSLSHQSFYVLKNDGTLYLGKPVYGSDGSKSYSLEYVASNVALSGKPLSSIQAKAKNVGGFSDVTESDWFADPVLWAVNQNITTGTSATTFTPGRDCSVAEILTFLWRAKGKPAPTIANPFTDVPAGQYYTDAAIWAYEQRLVEGATFGGSAPCTRAMAVTYLWKLAGSPGTGDHAYYTSDVPVSIKDPVTWAIDQNITTGVSKNPNGSFNFAPNVTCTRGHIVTFLYRAYANQ